MNFHIFSLIRDEAYLLKKWIPYHASIAGWDNIHIIDQNSDDIQCVEVLSFYKNKGIEVLRTNKNFTQKAQLLTQLMHKYKSKSDILIPMDADEFLCLAEPDNTLNADPQVIREHLHALPLNGKKYAFNIFEAVVKKMDYDDPLIDMTYFTFFEGKKDAIGPNQQTKTFFPAKNFSYTDQGNHKGGVLLAPNDIYNTSGLALAHFHMQGFDHFRKKLNKAIDAYQFKTLPPDYVGMGMRWNRWYQETKNLDEQEIKEWFRKNFVQEHSGMEQLALSKVLQSLNAI